jgi:hypothetical protein
LEAGHGIEQVEMSFAGFTAPELPFHRQKRAIVIAKIPCIFTAKGVKPNRQSGSFKRM